MILGWFLELVSRIRFVTGPDFSRAVQPELQCWKRLTAGGGGATRLKEYQARWTTKVLWPSRPRLGLDTIKLRVHQRRNRFRRFLRPVIPARFPRLLCERHRLYPAEKRWRLHGHAHRHRNARRLLLGSPCSVCPSTGWSLRTPSPENCCCSTPRYKQTLDAGNKE